MCIVHALARIELYKIGHFNNNLDARLDIKKTFLSILVNMCFSSNEMCYFVVFFLTSVRMKLVGAMTNDDLQIIFFRTIIAPFGKINMTFFVGAIKLSFSVSSIVFKSF